MLKVCLLVIVAYAVADIPALKFEDGNVACKIEASGGTLMGDCGSTAVDILSGGGVVLDDALQKIHNAFCPLTLHSSATASFTGVHTHSTADFCRYNCAANMYTHSNLCESCRSECPGHGYTLGAACDGSSTSDRPCTVCDSSLLPTGAGNPYFNSLIDCSWTCSPDYAKVGNTCVSVATPSPTHSPTEYPTDSPTEYPTESPTPYPTDSPTPYPTDSPTLSPTKHACNDGTHGCDLTSTYCAAVQGTHGYVCQCKNGYHAYSLPPSSTSCTLITASPTPYPTDSPTPYPTDSPTPYPTDSPTPYPTDSPTCELVYGCFNGDCVPWAETTQSNYYGHCFHFFNGQMQMDVCDYYYNRGAGCRS